MRKKGKRKETKRKGGRKRTENKEKYLFSCHEKLIYMKLINGDDREHFLISN